jgi:uncharacterized membrane protein
MTDERPLLDATLRPNPPMSPRALLVVLVLVATINLVFALSFVLRGAWPIAPFLGLDVALLAWALRESSIAARAFERITLTVSYLRIARHPARGNPSEIALNPYWVRVDFPDTGLPGAQLWLRSHGKSVQVGGFLGAEERSTFASALKSALRAARDG